MKTPAISNPANANSGPSPTSKTQGASSDFLFNQVLSRELADRSNVAEPNKTSPKESGAAAPAAQGAKAASSSNKANSTQQSKPSSRDEAETMPVAEGKPNPVEESKAKVEAETQSEHDQAELAAASDELLALVANLNPSGAARPDNTVAAEGSAPAVDPALMAMAQAASAAQAVDVATAGAAAAEKQEGKETTLAGVTDLLTDGSASDATAKGEALESTKFAAALAHAGDARDPKDPKSAPGAGSTPTQSTQTELAAAALSEPASRAPQPAQELQANVAPTNITAQTAMPLQQVQAAAAQAAERLAPRVGSPGWDQALGQKVVWMVAGSQQSASLTLNPPDLGPLQIVLNVSNNQATASFTAAQPEVRQALESAMPKLRDMLSEAGIQLGQTNVSAGTPNNQQGAFGNQQQPSSRRTSTPAGDNADPPARVIRSQAITGGQGLIDTFA
jgi:flagellar hook-length control protein FliK